VCPWAARSGCRSVRAETATKPADGRSRRRNGYVACEFFCASRTSSLQWRAGYLGSRGLQPISCASSRSGGKRPSAMGGTAKCSCGRVASVAFGGPFSWGYCAGIQGSFSHPEHPRSKQGADSVNEPLISTNNSNAARISSLRKTVLAN